MCIWLHKHTDRDNSVAVLDIFLSYLLTRHTFDSDIKADNPCVRSYLRRSSGRLCSTFGITNFAPFSSDQKRPSLPVMMIFCQNVDRTHIHEIFIMFLFLLNLYQIYIY